MLQSLLHQILNIKLIRFQSKALNIIGNLRLNSVPIFSSNCFIGYKMEKLYVLFREQSIAKAMQMLVYLNMLLIPFLYFNLDHFNKMQVIINVQNVMSNFAKCFYFSISKNHI